MEWILEETNSHKIYKTDPDDIVIPYLTIKKGERIFETRYYKLKDDEGFIKVLSKQNIQTMQITFVIRSTTIKTEPITTDIQSYYDYIDSLEQDLSSIIDDKHIQRTDGTVIHKNLEKLTRRYG